MKRYLPVGRDYVDGVYNRIAKVQVRINDLQIFISAKVKIMNESRWMILVWFIKIWEKLNYTTELVIDLQTEFDSGV